MIRVNRTKGVILTARPEKMDYGTYRKARKDQEKMIKNRLRYGFMVWPSVKGTLVGKVPAIKFD